MLATTQTSNRIQLRNVLYASDFSPASIAALPYAADFARHFGGTLTLLHVRPANVYSFVPPETWAELGAAQDTEARREANELLQSFAQVACEVVVAEGNVWRAMEPLLGEKSIDLIVVGTAGREGLDKFLLGSTAEEIFRQARCPVLTVGPHVPASARKTEGFGHILCAADFGKASQAAVVYATSLAQEYQAQLTMLHVIENAKTGELITPAQLMDASLRLLDLSEEAKAWCRPQPLVKVGEPAPTILQVANECGADLIVLGLHNQLSNGAATHLPMATAHKVVARAACPVLTIRTLASE